jgi:hypothetical protein
MSRLVNKILVFDDGSVEITKYNSPTPLLDELWKKAKYCKLKDGTPCTCRDMMDELMIDNALKTMK